MLLQSHTLSWFRASYSVFLLVLEAITPTITLIDAVRTSYMKMKHTSPLYSSVWLTYKSLRIPKLLSEAIKRRIGNCQKRKRNILYIALSILSHIWLLVWYFKVTVVVFYATFNNISVISRPSVLLVEEIGVSEETTQFRIFNVSLQCLIFQLVCTRVCTINLSLNNYNIVYNVVSLVVNDNITVFVFFLLSSFSYLLDEWRFHLKMNLP